MKASLWIAVLLLSANCFAVEIAVKSGEKVAFLGDSITQFGANSPSGYVNLVGSGLATAGIKIKMIKAGISGHKSNQMLARLDKVLAQKPDWLLLSCGVNDVMHGTRGIELEPYKKNITAIIDSTLAAGVKVMILTATMISENPEHSSNKKLAAYNDFLRQTAKEKNLLVADLNAAMQEKVKALKAAGFKGNTVTVDGVHMNELGDLMMARGVLEGFGMDEETLKKTEASWMALPVCYGLNPRRGVESGFKHHKRAYAKFTLQEVLTKNADAQKAGSTFQHWLNQEIQQGVNTQLGKQ